MIIARGGGHELRAIKPRLFGDGTQGHLRVLTLVGFRSVESLDRQLLHRLKTDGIQPRIYGDAISGHVVLAVGSQLRALGAAQEPLQRDTLCDLSPEGGVINVSCVSAPAPSVVRAHIHDLAQAVLLYGYHRHFPKARLPRWIRIDQQHFGSRFGPRHLGDPVERRQLFPKRDVLLLLVRQSEHRISAAGCGQFEPDRFLGRRIQRRFERGAVELDRQHLFHHCPAIGVR